LIINLGTAKATSSPNLLNFHKLRRDPNAINCSYWTRTKLQFAAMRMVANGIFGPDRLPKGA
jgi:hypothetical protein